jgi:hypothetical protein
MNTQRKNIMTPLIAAAFLAAASLSWGQETLLANWNFNETVVASKFAPTRGSGTLTTNWLEANLGDTTGIWINLVPGDSAGRDLGFINGGATGNAANEGRWLQFEIDMTGYEGLAFSYAGRTTSTALRHLEWFYSTDGLAFTSLGTVDHVSLFGAGNYGLVQIDLSGISVINNQSQVLIRGVLTTLDGQTAPGSTGSNRFDNVQFTAIPEPSTYAALFGVAALAAAIVIRRRRK